MSRIFLSVCLLVLALCAVAAGALEEPAGAQAAEASSAVDSASVAARLIADVKAVSPGKPFKLGVEISMAPGWHTYYKESGDAGMPTRIEWQLPAGFSAGPLIWQKPERFDETGIVTYGYKDKTVIAAEIAVPESLPAAAPLRFSARVKWLGCKDVCVPGSAKVQLDLPVTARAAEPDNREAFNFVGFQGAIASLAPAGAPAQTTDIMAANLKVDGGADSSLGLPAYLLFAFIGGFILNFMPCVLPVISIKVLSFVEQAGESNGRVFQLGLTFCAGIIASFLALAGTAIAIQQAGQSVGWGFQFQYPGFVVGMCVLVLLLAMSLFGVFYVNFSAGQGGIDRLASGEGFAGTFFKGVLATTLATPCTAPFLGTALGFAFAQPWWIVLSIFLTAALGMSSPYLVLTARPGWMRFIPRPGAWMEKFKESMGFVLLATVIWLLSVLGRQTGLDGVVWTACFLTCVAFSAWLVGRFIDLTTTVRKQAVIWILALTVSGAGYFTFMPMVPGLSGAPARDDHPPGTGREADLLDWQPFDIAALNEALSANKTVFLDFTAQWCLTCKVNEQTAIDSAPVAAKMKELAVVPMKADWTGQDPAITRMLKKFGRSGVPLYVIFPAGRPTEPIVLPEVISQQLIIDKLTEAGPSSQVRPAR